MSKPTHPPVPLNCSLIQAYSNGNLYLLYENRQHGCRFNFGDCLDTRNIIAAVAEVAWRKEADSARDGIFRQTRTEVLCDQKKRLARAETNAQAWRKWAEQEVK